MSAVLPFALGLGLFGCGAKTVVCQVIDIANQVCPLIPIQTKNGVVMVPKDRVEHLTEQVRLEQSQKDGGK